MEAIVHQALGHVFGHHAAGLFQAAQIQNALVGHVTPFAVGAHAGIQRWVVIGQALADVIGGQDSSFCGVLQTLGAHHAAIHPADGQHGGIAQRRRRHSTHAVDFQATRGMTWQVRHQIFHHTNRAHAWAATAVGNAESFVQVEVTHIATKFAWRCNTHQRIHVGAVHIHAAAVLVNQFAQRFDLCFKHAMRAGVGDHDGSQVVTVLLALGFQIDHVHVALRIASCDHHLHARHLRTGGIGAVGARWNEADVAMTLTLGFMERFDDQQASVFTLRARVGLQADTGIARGLAQPVTQLLIEQGIALELVGGCKGVHVGKLGPRDGNHLAGGIELHGARAQRNHAAIERQIFVAQLADVAQHACFGVIPIEHRVCEVRTGASQACGNEAVATLFKRCPVGQGLAAFSKARPNRFDVVTRGGFVQRHGNAVG